MPKINLGCGPFNIKGYINIDLKMLKAVTLVADGCYLPLKDNSIDYLYAGHYLEHIEDINITLREILRVLKPNTFAMFIIPDYTKLCRLYIEREMVLDELGFILSGQKLDHLHPLNSRDVQELLKQNGFTDIKDIELKENPKVAGKGKFLSAVRAKKE